MGANPVVVLTSPALWNRPRPSRACRRGAVMLTFPCSGCQKTLAAKEDLVGQKVRCPGCGYVSAVPARIAVSANDVTAPPTPPPAAPPFLSSATLSNPDPTQGGGGAAERRDPLTDFLAP